MQQLSEMEVLIYALTNRANTIILVRAYINKSVVLLVRIFYRVSRPDRTVCVSPRPNVPLAIYLTGTNRAPLPLVTHYGYVR